MSAIPNDRRTRQLYLDAAIKRAQAKAREARRQVDRDAEVPVTATTMTTMTLRNYAALPGPRDAKD